MLTPDQLNESLMRHEDRMKDYIRERFLLHEAAERVMVGAVEDSVRMLNKDFHRHLHGDGSDDNPGIIKEVDRLKQHRKMFGLPVVITQAGLLIEKAVSFFRS